MPNKMEWKILQVGSAVSVLDTFDYSDDVSLPSAFPLPRVYVSFLSLSVSVFSSLFPASVIFSPCRWKSTQSMA